MARVGCGDVSPVRVQSVLLWRPTRNIANAAKILTSIGMRLLSSESPPSILAEAIWYSPL